MSKKGLLKAEFNRVRTSTALKANDMWTTTIGQSMDPQAGSNSAIEASIYAPTRGGGNRAARQAKAAEMVESAGYQATVTDYKGLLSLAKAQGIGNTTRGACKLCGCLGHLTRKCTNVLTGHTAHTGIDQVPGAVPGQGAGGQVLGLLPELKDLDSDVSSELTSSSDGGSDSGSSSSSESDSSSERRRERKRKRKESSSSKEKSKNKKHKKEKSSKRSKKHRKEKSGKKDKKEKKSRRD